MSKYNSFEPLFLPPCSQKNASSEKKPHEEIRGFFEEKIIITNSYRCNIV